MSIELSEDRRAALLSAVRGLYAEAFDEEISPFRAEQILDFFLQTVGPQVYNQAVQDARIFMLRKLEDLEGEVYEPEVDGRGVA